MALSLKESLEAMSANTTSIQSNSIPSPIAKMTNPEIELEITVDMDTRTITVPSELYNIGVVSDNNAETVYIRVPVTTFDGISLTDKTAYIKYINAGNEYNIYEIKETEIENDTIKLGWTIDNKVTQFPGIIHFQLSFELNTNYTWSTLPATMNVLAGLDIDNTISQSETAVVSALFVRINELENIVSDNVSSIASIKNDIKTLKSNIETIQADITYLKNHVVYILDDIE